MPLVDVNAATFSEWINGYVQKLVDFLQSALQRLLSSQRDPSRTTPVFQIFNSLRDPRDRHPKESYLETSKAMTCT